MPATKSWIQVAANGWADTTPLSDWYIQCASLTHARWLTAGQVSMKLKCQCRPIRFSTNITTVSFVQKVQSKQNGELKPGEQLQCTCNNGAESWKWILNWMLYKEYCEQDSKTLADVNLWIRTTTVVVAWSERWSRAIYQWHTRAVSIRIGLVVSVGVNMRHRYKRWLQTQHTPARPVSK